MAMSTGENNKLGWTTELDISSQMVANPKAFQRHISVSFHSHLATMILDLIAQFRPWWGMLQLPDLLI